MTWKKVGGGKTVEGSDGTWDKTVLLASRALGTWSAAWQSICTIINSFYIYSACMHYPLSPPVRPHSRKMTLYKKRPSFFGGFVFFLETNLYVWTILTSKCVSSCLFFFIFLKFQNSATLLAMMFSGCINILDIMVFITLSCPWILPVCDKSSIAGQELAIFKYHKGRERLSFKHLAQTTTFVSVISSKGDPLTEIGANGIFRNNTLLQTKTPLVQYDEHMMASSQHTSVCTLHTRKVTCT